MPPLAPESEQTLRFLLDSAPAAIEFHSKLPNYEPTPLVSLPCLAARLGVGRILVKDESKRFSSSGLNAFKCLGSSFAMQQHMQQHTISESVTFITATDGNHGRGVAWAAAQLGLRAVVLVPSCTVPARISAIASYGARVIQTDGNYDQTVAQAAAMAQENGWILLQDTAWPGYTDVPLRIMAGYLTIFHEIQRQLATLNASSTSQPPPQPDSSAACPASSALPESESGTAAARGGGGISHVFTQAGVGSFPCAAAAHYAGCAKLVVVEPLDADCCLESSLAPDRGIRSCKGRQESLMAGLNCGTPSTVAWPLLRDTTSLFLALPDSLACEAMRTLRYPLQDDPPIISGESGCAGLAGLLFLCLSEQGASYRQQLGLSADSTVLLINTEGDTDPTMYQKIVQHPPFWHSRS